MYMIVHTDVLGDDLHCVCMLQVMNHSAQVTDAIQWIQLHLSFDVDERVHVFELTIRAVGM